MTINTSKGSQRMIDKLQLRESYRESGELSSSPNLDVDIWDIEINNASDNLGK